jgi:chromosome segregation ATPase
MQLPKVPQTPRTLHRWIVVRVLASSVMLGGCVQATAYEQATSAAAVHAEGRRRLGDELEQNSAKLATLQRQYAELKAENSRLQQELLEQKGAFDQAELDLVLAKQEKNEEASLVQQLRGDLARVGSHLDVYADEKADLDAALKAARAENEKLTAQLATVENEDSAPPEVAPEDQDSVVVDAPAAAAVEPPPAESMPPADAISD